MEAENGVLPDCGNGGIAEKTLCVGGLGLDLAKEKENVDLAVDLLEVNGISIDPSNAEEINSSNAEDEASAVVSDNKRSNDSSKKSGIERVKNVKSAKNQAVHKAPSMFSRNQRSGLSQSLSLPPKKIVTHTLRSSNTTINARPNGTEPVSPVSNGSLTSTSRSNSFIKSFASGMTSNSDANKGGVSSNRSTLTPGLTTRHSLPGKNGSLNTSSNGSASKISQPCEHDQKSSGGAFPIKDDDDAHSTTSSTTSRNQRRNSGGSTFASRLDERAQKRKVFFTKLEEKIQAKEDEKNDIQAKSKENQEEEIKQLRKNLAFKATPMPTFYQEPGPPKVELKKIPTTRPKSPKLGRNKSSAAVTESSDRQRRSSYPSLDLIKPNGGTTNRNGDSSTLKKPIRRSLVKPPSQNPTATKAEVKSRSSKPKTTNSDEKMCNGESLENPLMSSDVLFPATETATAELESIQDTEENETILDLPDPVLTSNEVSVMG